MPKPRGGDICLSISYMSMKVSRPLGAERTRRKRHRTEKGQKRGKRDRDAEKKNEKKKKWKKKKRGLNPAGRSSGPRGGGGEGGEEGDGRCPCSPAALEVGGPAVLAGGRGAQQAELGRDGGGLHAVRRGLGPAPGVRDVSVYIYIYRYHIYIRETISNIHSVDAQQVFSVSQTLQATL